MANTTFRLTASKADTPISGDNPSANPASTPGDSSPKAGNTGFLTQTTTKDVLGVVSSPIVSGAFIFASFILLFALIAKIKKNKQANFKDSLNKKHYTTRILAFATFLALIAGIGGTAVRFMGAKADTEIDSLTTSGTINASLIEVTDDYKLYCGTDQLVLDQESVPYGNFLFMHPEGDGVLPTTTSGITNIASAEDWDGLGIGEWGYFVGTIADRESATTNPMPVNYSIISHEVETTTKTTIPVTYCAKISKNIEEAEFETTIEYELMPKEEYDLYPSLDFNSTEDDDFDGLSNREENRYGMNPLSADSDMDSLSDYDELKVHHTDPLVEDTDEDGLADYSEVALSEDAQYSFDPNSPDYNGESLTYTGEVGGDSDITYTVTGTGDIPLTYIDVANPVDIDESLGNISGKAYTFQSAGEIDDANITVPYTTETEQEASDDDVLGAAVGVSDGNITADDIAVTSFTFDEENTSEDDETIPATIESATKTVDNTNKTISINVKDNSAILLVNDNTNTDDDTLGAGLLSKVFNKVKETAKKVVTAVKNFLTGKKDGSGEKETIIWSVSNKFSRKNDTVTITNADGYYDDETNKYYSTNGYCYGIALLQRLLYKNKIDLGISHVIDNDTDRFFNIDFNDFSLIGLTKQEVLKNIQTRKNNKIGLSYIGLDVIGAQGRALAALSEYQYNSNVHITYPYINDTKEWFIENVSCDYGCYSIVQHDRSKGPEKFMDIIRNKIDKNNTENGDDPVTLGVWRISDKIGKKGWLVNGHIVNATAMKGILTESGTKKYEISVYDSTFSIDKFKAECSKVTCTANGQIGGATFYANSMLAYLYLIDDDYFLNN